MIQEVRINFQDFSEQVLGDQKKNYQQLDSIMSDLNRCSQTYCIVLNVIQGPSLPDYSSIGIRLEALFQNLTRRELEVYELAVKGFANKEIAEQLFISLETVKSHRKRIVSKAAVRRIEDIKDWLLEANTFRPI